MLFLFTCVLNRSDFVDFGSQSLRYVSVPLLRALQHCEEMIQRYSRALNNSSLSLSGAALPHCSFSNVGKAVEDCMRAVIGVLLNLTHDNGTPRYSFQLVAFSLVLCLFATICVCALRGICWPVACLLKCGAIQDSSFD